MAAALFAALIGAAVCPAQQMVGNYRAAAKNEETVVSAANFAVKTRGATEKSALKLIAVERAEQQVVAGMNYRLCLSVKSGGKTEQATAVVYHNLQNEFELSEWRNGNCAGAAATTKSSDARQKNTSVGSTVANTPDAVVKNLYAAQKAGNGPFFQKENRAVVDKYFAPELADTIWKDATSAGDGVGALDFDPLFYAQDTQITNFVIAKADANNMVKVRFKNMGKNEEIVFSLTKENTASKTWKIDSIGYSDAEDLGSILEYGMLTEAEMKEADSMNKLDGDYLVGAVKCNFTTNKSGYWARVKCDDQPNFQVVDTETLTFGTFNPQEKGRRGRFVSPEYGIIEKYVDAAGKEYKVKRLK